MNKKILKTTEDKTPKAVRKMVGLIVSDKMTKTRVVQTTEIRRHPIYGKTFAVTAKIKVHDEEEAFKTGDKVEITQTRPKSRDKSWKITRKVK